MLIQPKTRIKMGSTESQEAEKMEEQPYEPNGDIKIVVESGFSGGNPRYGRQWHGSIIAILFIKPDTTVASFLNTVMALPLPKNHWPVTIHSLSIGKFQPTENDLQRTVGEMGLISGSLHLYNGAMD